MNYQYILIGLCFFVVTACNSGSADMEFDINFDLNSFAYDDSTACNTATDAGEGSTTSSCGGTLTGTSTAEEKGGQCNAKDVKVTWTFTYPDGSTESHEVDFGNISKEGDKSKEESIHFKNLNLIGDLSTSGDDDFDSECSGSTGLGI